MFGIFNKWTNVDTELANIKTELKEITIKMNVINATNQHLQKLYQDLLLDKTEKGGVTVVMETVGIKPKKKKGE